MEKDLGKCRTNLIHFRSHIVRKKTEADFDREEMQNLGPREAIVIVDYKMKILDQGHCETMSEWFGKRGTTCFGEMTITNVEQSEDTVEFHFYLFFSDDITQDTNWVHSAKAWLYKNFIPTLFPESDKPVKTYCCGDSATVFNNNIGKLCMPL